jgi:hypothetical protein
MSSFGRGRHRRARNRYASRFHELPLMRNLILVILGIAVGAAGTASIQNTLARRDAYARGVMAVMQHHLAGLREDVRAGRCSGAGLSRHRTMLTALAEEIEPSVYADAAADPPFREYSQRLREALAQLPDAGADCAATAPIASKIADSCETCHRQYR